MVPLKFSDEYIGERPHHKLEFSDSYYDEESDSDPDRHNETEETFPSLETSHVLPDYRLKTIAISLETCE